MQTTLLGLAMAFIIALMAALIGPYFIDWNQFRPHFEAEAKKAKVEVELQNHPLMDSIQPKLDMLKTRKPGEPNPFVVGRGAYQKFLEVMGACTEVNIARRKGL